MASYAQRSVCADSTKIDRKVSYADNDEFFPDGENGRNEASEDDFVELKNPNIGKMEQDILYHLALGSGSHDLEDMFGDVKFVVMGGTPRRMEEFAYFIMNELDIKLPTGTTLSDISRYSYRYSMYKIGPIISVSHGMGQPSISILLHELIKMMYHSRVRDPVFIRLGTCGGIGVEGGTVVVTEEAVDGCLNPKHTLTILGKKVSRPAVLDLTLVSDLVNCSSPGDPWKTVCGKTMCTDDFYEDSKISKQRLSRHFSVRILTKFSSSGQARLDGAFCEYTEAQKMDFLKYIHGQGVINIEMESLVFASLCHCAGIRAAVICVALLNRLNGDQVSSSKEVLKEWQQRPQILLSRYIKQKLGLATAAERPPLVSSPSINSMSRMLQKSLRSKSKLNMVNQESQSFE
ncbi:unnamed protein product [Cyprideis torosa]|uniref:Uncharacterized protein n=1 Tax=Cyprideis torosa TaxID=163714 RepID=A0A7R8WJ52_9CRUS|nr:unnamed protein product [Cyprideis torosa]CAG0901571.1 unnamed protein product [Cyprideis torosa]